MLTFDDCDVGSPLRALIAAEVIPGAAVGSAGSFAPARGPCSPAPRRRRRGGSPRPACSARYRLVRVMPVLATDLGDGGPFVTQPAGVIEAGSGSQLTGGGPYGPSRWLPPERARRVPTCRFAPFEQIGLIGLPPAAPLDQRG